MLSLFLFAKRNRGLLPPCLLYAFSPAAKLPECRNPGHGFSAHGPSESQLNSSGRGVQPEIFPLMTFVTRTFPFSAEILIEGATVP
jgi:hypothetical protein